MDGFIKINQIDDDNISVISKSDFELL